MVSLQPSYDDSSLAFDAGLTGAWISTEDGTRLDIEEAEWRSYKLMLHDGPKITTVTAHLTHAGTRDLLDVMPLAGVDLPPMTLPVHGIFVIHRDGDRLSTQAIDFDALRARVRRHAAPIAMSLDERDDVVITAPVDALRQWLSIEGPGGPPLVTPIAWTRAQAG